MMFLMNGMRAEVEQVPGKKNWYQLTGKHIERWTLDISETFNELELSKIKVHYKAKILGIHSMDSEIALYDPRFNHENDPDRSPSFGVYTEEGRTFMLLAVNQAEYTLFRFLAPHEAAQAGNDADEYDPMSYYRTETKPAAAPKSAKKAAPKKKPKATA